VPAGQVVPDPPPPPLMVQAGQAAACDPQALMAALVEERVGGAFWAPEQDPWTRVARDDDEARLVAALRGGGACGAAVAERIMASGVPHDPFTGEPTDWIAAVRLLGGWRRLIEANRAYAAIFGIAGWKRTTLDALLWDGTGPVRSRSDTRGLRSGWHGWRAVRRGWTANWRRWALRGARSRTG
jgi:capsular polysaccharide export protein